MSDDDTARFSLIVEPTAVEFSFSKEHPGQTAEDVARWIKDEYSAPEFVELHCIDLEFLIQTKTADGWTNHTLRWTNGVWSS